MSAPVTGRIRLVLVATDGREPAAAVEQAGAGSARCGTRVPGGVVGSPVHVAVGVGVGLGVCLGVGVIVGVGVGVGVTARMHVHVGVDVGVVMHVVHLGTGVAWLMHWHVGVGVGAPVQLQSGCAVAAAGAAGSPGRMPPRTAAPGLPAVVASAMPPPYSPSRAAASATTIEAAINLTKSPVFPSPQTLRILTESNQLRCVTLTPARALRRNYRPSATSFRGTGTFTGGR
jgi:hypothetical protein